MCVNTYTFDITKCDEIFDFLVVDGQIIVPKGLKTPPLEQRKKRGFCRFHTFLGHKTSNCVLFRDLVQKTLTEGRLKFGDKAKAQMKIDIDPLQVSYAMYIEPINCLMVEASTEIVDYLVLEATIRSRGFYASDF